MGGERVTGGRVGAAVDIGIWLATLAGLLGAVTWLSLHVPRTGLLMQIGAPAEMAVLFVVSTLLLRRRGEGWRSVGLTAPPPGARVAGLVVGGYLAIVALNAVCVLVLFPALGLAMPSFGAFGALKGHPGVFAYWLLAAWTSAALGEELQFRGFLRSRLERLFGSGRGAVAGAIVGQAVLFGLGHIYQGWAGVLVTGMVGLVLGVLFLAARRNLVPGMVLHALVDTVGLTALFLGFAPPAP